MKDSGLTPIRRLHPEAGIAAATDEQLLQWYAPPPGVLAQWVRFNFISSLDGSSTLHGLSGALGSAADKRIFDLLRRPAAVILIGAQTVRSEGYAGPLLDGEGVRWRQEHGLAAHPVPAVISGSLQLDPDSPFFTEAPVRPIVVTGHNSSKERRRQFERRADVIVCGGNSIDVDILLDELAARGHRQILCEGGPHLFGSFQEAGRVDELCLTLSPVLVAGEDMRIAVTGTPTASSTPMRLEHVLAGGDMLFLRYSSGRSGG